MKTFERVQGLEIKPGQSRTIVGLEIIVQPSQTPPEQAIPQCWRQFAPRIQEIAGQIENGGIYGLFTYEPPFAPGQDFRYLAGVEVDGSAPIPKGMTARTIEEAEFAVVAYKGEWSHIVDAWDYYYGCWLPESDYESLQSFEYERYDEKFNSITDGDIEIELYFPIRKKALTKLTDKTWRDPKAGFELQDLRNEKIHMATFRGSELHGIDMRNVSFRHTNFVNSRWEHIYFSNVHINHTQLGGTVFENVQRPKGDSSRFEEEPGTEGWVNLEPVTFRNSDLTKAIFEGCNLKDVDIRNCEIDGLRIDGIPVKELLEKYRQVTQ